MSETIHTQLKSPGPRGNGRILVAMSGGVDSSLTAALLKEAGWDCEGVTMRLYRLPGQEAAADRDARDAAAVAGKLGIPHKTVDFSEAFRKCVIREFIDVYEAGGTPNPCITCNRTIKFGRLLDYAAEQGLDYLATGHYARVEYDRDRGRWLLRKAADPAKDQSYVLYSLTQEQLSRIILPLGEYSKSEVRASAGERGFVNAEKPESQDICFIPDGGYADFIEKYTGKTFPEGRFIDAAGRKIGTHRGAIRYTIGQRRGLGLAVGSPVYVLDKNMEDNTVTVGDESALFKRDCIVGSVNWIAMENLPGTVTLKAMPRYRKKEAAAEISPLEDGRVLVRFEEPQRALTPGQSMVFYDGDIVAGGGILEEVK